ncbi:MAG: L-histidine N(alpha)-methyltransferase [Pseudomonadota bacterium]
MRTETDYTFHHVLSEIDDFYQEVIDGLSQPARFIPPKYFYDHAGSRLFESICEQPEYYLTRTENALLKQYASEIAALAGDGCYVIEPGSGSCEKVRPLLDELRPAAYVPLDISCAHLERAAACMAEDYPWLDIHAVCTDITAELSLPFIPEQARSVLFYPGSSIGNFDPQDAVAFMTCLAKMVDQGGGLLIGVDLKKEQTILDAAYNDANGITAAFNLNVLQRINCELAGDFDIKAFAHHAFYNSVRGRIEMHLVSEHKQTVRVDGHSFEFNAGDSIHTENSYKYTIDEFQELAQQAGFMPCRVWTDNDALFSLHYLRAV